MYVSVLFLCGLSHGYHISSINYLLQSCFLVSPIVQTRFVPKSSRREYSSLSSEMVDDSTHSGGDNVRGMYRFCVRLEKCIGDLKGLLFHSKCRSLVCNVWEVVGKQLTSNLYDYPQIKGEMVVPLIFFCFKLCLPERRSPCFKFLGHNICQD